MDPCSATGKEHDVSFETIRSWWKVPAISHFCSLFRTTFKLPDFEIEELEEALYLDSEVDISRFLIDLLTGLLKGSYETGDIDDNNYSDYLRDICNIHWEKENRVNPLNNADTSFQSLSTLMKVEILYTLCDYRLDANDVTILKDYDGDTLRVEPLGIDSKLATYWYFYGTRLYREDVPPPRPPKAKQKKRKKKKKSPEPEPPPKKGKQGKQTSSSSRERKGREHVASPTGRKRTRHSRAAESSGESEGDDGDEDDDVPLATMASPPRKSAKGSSPVATKKRDKHSGEEKETPKKGGRSPGRSRDRKKHAKKEDEKSDVSKKASKDKRLSKKEAARLEAEAAATEQKRTSVGRGRKGKRNATGKGNISETDETMSLADMKRSKVTPKSSRKEKRKSSGKGAKGRGRGKQDESSGDDADDQPEVKKKKKSPACSPPLITLWSNEEESSSSSESSSSEEEPEPAKWQLVCQTEEDWQALTDSFKDSKIKCERELHQILADNFLPAIHALFTAKEREFRKKLQDLAPKRASSRIAVKKCKQVEEDKMKALVEHEEEQRHKEEVACRREYVQTERRKRVQADGRRKMADEMREKEEVKQLKTLKRQERLVERKNPSAKQKKKSLYEGLKKVLDTVRKHPDAWPFVDPVQESFAPAYYDIIQHPMDISTIEVKVQEEMYRSKAKFEADMELIISNCVEYNGPESEYTMMGANVASCFQEALDQHFPPGSISDGELSDIASDQDSAYCLSYPRELRRRSMALNYTEMESTSDSGDTGKDEDDDERMEEKPKEIKVFPSYLAEKGQLKELQAEDGVISDDTSDHNSVSQTHNGDEIKVIRTQTVDVIENGDKRTQTEDVIENGDKKDDGKVAVGANERISECVPKSTNDKTSEKPILTKLTDPLVKQEKGKKSSPKKKSPKTKKFVNETKKVKIKHNLTKETNSSKSEVLEENFPNFSDSDTNDSQLTSLQRLEAITDRLGKSLDTRKDFRVKSDNSLSNKCKENPKIKCSSPQPGPVVTLPAKVNEDLRDSHSKLFNKEMEATCLSSTYASPPPLKIKSETPSFSSCSSPHIMPSKPPHPEVASPLVVPSNLSTVYNPINPSDLLSTPAKSSMDNSSSSLKAEAISYRQSLASAAAVDKYFAQLSSPQKIGEGDFPRSYTDFRSGNSDHFSAFHSVGKDHGLSRPRIESSVNINQGSFPGQLMPAPSQLGSLVQHGTKGLPAPSHLGSLVQHGTKGLPAPSQLGSLVQHGTKGLPYSTFVSPGTATQATSSKLNDCNSPFQSSNTYPNQPTIVRPVSRYPAQAQAIRQNQYLLQSGAISNQAPNMGPQLNILQIASAPSLTLNIQPNGLLHSQSLVNVAASRQAMPGMYGQGMNPVNNHMMQNNLQQKPTLVVQYQGTLGETPPYGAQFRTSYQ